jgi:hypothetical protein
MDRMQAPEAQAVIEFAQTCLKVVSLRVLTLLALLGCSVMFGYAMLEPNWMRLVGAGGFALLVFWPCVRLESNRKEVS